MSTIFTIGHSTRALPDFHEMLIAHGVKLVVDVRRYPGSRRYPHFAKEALSASLAEHGIGYLHEPDLGGRRRPRADSPHTFWRSASFRAYADYMETEPFQQALARLIAESQQRTAAIMCAEAVPWRCHRQLIADSLVAHGHDVLDILSATRADPHQLNPAAQLLPSGQLLYQASADDQGQRLLDLG